MKPLRSIAAALLGIARRALMSGMVLPIALGVCAAWALVRAAAIDPDGWYGSNTAAWVQAIGTIIAVWAAVWIDQAARERAEADRKARDAALMITCSRLVTGFWIKSKTRLDILQEPDCESAYAGEPTLRGYEVMLRALQNFPVASIPEPNAVLIYTSALQSADTILLFLGQVDKMSERAARVDQKRQVVQFAIRHLSSGVEELGGLERALRDLAEPGWRANVKGAS